MSKAILMSIQPKWCELIASGKKTVEVRKTRPKFETPFKVYIYCTLQGSNEFFQSLKNSLGEYEALSKWNRENWGVKKGKIIGEFVCDYIEDFKEFEYGVDSLHRHIKLNAYIGYDEIYKYLGFEKCGYGWHISNLVIYDEPKELSEFHQCHKCLNTCVPQSQYLCEYHRLKRPPQSWCYVEELSE